MPDVHKNFSYSTVLTAPSPATSGTSLVVQSGDGAKFPTPPFNATVWIAGANPITTNAEIVRVTAIATDTLTIVRAQESSSARTVVVGDQIAATITAKTLTDAETPAESQVTFTDITTGNVSTTKHGFAPKGSASTLDFLNGNGLYTQPVSYQLAAYNILGGSIKAESLPGPINLASGTAVISNGVVRFVAVYLPIAATITGVKFIQGLQGAYTASNYNGVGVYSISAGTLTLQASSTDDGNLWKGATNALITKAFSSTVALNPGVYFVGLLYCRSAATTEPQLGSYVAFNAQGVDFTNSVRMNTQVTGNSFPSSQAMSGTSITALQTYVALY